jgi:hypothetical protein
VDRLREAQTAYREIEQFFTSALQSNTVRDLNAEIDRRFGDFAHFTPTKKLDLLLWQWRR